jgi:hypothetical protein
MACSKRPVLKVCVRGPVCGACHSRSVKFFCFHIYIFDTTCIEMCMEGTLICKNDAVCLTGANATRTRIWQAPEAINSFAADKHLFILHVFAILFAFVLHKHCNTTVIMLFVFFYVLQIEGE